MSQKAASQQHEISQVLNNKMSRGLFNINLKFPYFEMSIYCLEVYALHQSKKQGGSKVPVTKCPWHCIIDEEK
jgi:hypothetical protein